MTCDPGVLRLTVRVRPNSARPSVGGAYGDGELVVAVAQRAVDGAANAAVLRALAAAFGVRASQVVLVRGHTHRTKLIDIADDPQALRRRLRVLLGDAPTDLSAGPESPDRRGE